MLGDDVDKFFLYLADNVEFICEGSLHLLLDGIVFSGKLKSVSSVKLFTLCLSSGIINWRPPLFGGGALEIIGMELFLKSAEFRRVHEQYRGRIVGFVDRGFGGLPRDLLADTHLLHPGVEQLRGQYSAEHAVWKQVHKLPCMGTHSPVAISYA